MGESYNKAADLIRKTTNYTRQQHPHAQSSIHRSSIFPIWCLQKHFLAALRRMSLEAPVNNSGWGVHLSKQLSFENCLYCLRLPILQSGGRIKSIKSEDPWVISPENCCPSCDYLATVAAYVLPPCHWCPRISLHLLAALWSCSPQLLSFTTLAGLAQAALSPSPQLPSPEMPRECPAGLTGCGFQFLLTGRQEAGRKYHKVLLLLRQPELLLRKAVKEEKLLQSSDYPSVASPFFSLLLGASSHHFSQ